MSAFVFTSASGQFGSPRAFGIRPDLAATWDTVIDDVIDVQVRTQGDVHTARVRALGGRVAFYDGDRQVELELDCTRPELLCPSELLASELELDNRAGDVNDDGDRLVLSFEGEGEGDCRLLPGSMAAAAVEVHGSAVTRNFRAVALTAGTLTAVLSAACLGPASGLPADAEVVLTSGFTASRR